MIWQSLTLNILTGELVKAGELMSMQSASAVYTIEFKCKFIWQQLIKNSTPNPHSKKLSLPPCWESEMMVYYKSLHSVSHIHGCIPVEDHVLHWFPHITLPGKHQSTPQLLFHLVTMKMTWSHQISKLRFENLQIEDKVAQYCAEWQCWTRLLCVLTKVQ